MSKYKILIVEDEQIVIDVLKLLLDKLYLLEVAKNGKEALIKYEEFNPDIIISDISMPILNGIEMAKEIRKNDINTKIIFLSALSDIDTLLNVSNLKLSKYIVKPVESNELFDSINNCIEELEMYTINKNKILKLDSQTIWDIDKATLYKNSQEIYLTPKEKKIIIYLIKNQNIVSSYDDIIDEVWDDFQDTNKEALKTMMTGLRKKLPKDSIRNIYGQGYKINLR